MPCPLLADCLDEIFENLVEDIITLHSCLLVNRLWCRVSVRILWRDIWSFIYFVTHKHQLEMASSILSTLISCFPNESKEILHKNEIFISTPTSKPPLFNYVSFCKVLSVNDISRIIHEVLKRDTSIASQNLKDKNFLISKEMLKMFMNQISSLKTLYHLENYNVNVPNNISFTHFPGARDCLTNLSELHCSSIVHSEFFYGLSQICHNLQSLNIYFESEVSSELKGLVSSQNNLKNLTLTAYNLNDWADIVPALTKHSNALTKLHFYGGNIDRLPLSFVSSFLNLQEINFSLIDGIQFEDFKKLQYVTFPRLQVLKIPYQHPEQEYLMKFLETNGKNLKEFYTGGNDKALNLSVAKFCPNLKKLFVVFNDGELNILKTIFNSYQYLEGIVISYGGEYMDEVFETVARYSPESFYKLKLHKPKLVPEDLESFFTSWKNRTSKKSLNLIIVDDLVKEENMKIIEKYKNLGVIKRFEAREYYSEEYMYL